jgi:hypothetical protein
MRPPKTKAVKGRKEQQHWRQADLAAKTRNDYSWKAGACLAAVVVALYWRVLANQFINFDDGSYILLNDHVKSGLTFDGLRWAFTEFSNANWHPLRGFPTCWMSSVRSECRPADDLRVRS